MKILVVVADSSEVATMKRLLAQAGMQGDVLAYATEKLVCKPSMKQVRSAKLWLDQNIEAGNYDVIIAAGETAARWVLDTSSVNINKLRGRDFEYQMGVKTPKKKVKDAES